MSQAPPTSVDESAHVPSADVSTEQPPVVPEQQPDGSEPAPQTFDDVSASSPWKYRIIKAVDVTGLTFLTPVIRLAYGEEPLKQLKDIGRYIVVPILAIVMFFMVWSAVAPRHKTKSGEVPTPKVVWKAAQGIWTFHRREGAKGSAYELSGDDRELKLKQVDARLKQLAKLAKTVNAKVDETVAKAETEKKGSVAPLLKKYEDKKAALDQSSEERVALLTTKGTELDASDNAALNAYIKQVQQHLETKEANKELLQELKAEVTEELAEKNPKVVDALDAQTKVAEEAQFLVAMREQLTTANQSLKIETNKKSISKREAKFREEAGSEGAFESAIAVVKGHERLATTRETDYAKPWTLPRQAIRSVICVFVGFLLGTIIAIPIGILCGLSSTFMAAMTPFIALFKPVSPIVWLPIALIVVGGFIENPDKHWLIQGLAEAPLIGWLQINPAFMACAITVALCSLWATMVNTAFGVASIEQDHLNVASVLRLNFKDRLFKIIIPSALPLIFAGMRISLGVGWMVLIAAELLSSSEGIGKYIWDAFSNGSSDSFAQMFFVVFLVGFVGLILDRTMIVLQRLVTFDGAPTSI